MNLKEYKSVICVLLIAILLFAFSTIVTSATNDDIQELGTTKVNNVSNENTYEGIREIEKINPVNNVNAVNDVKEPNKDMNVSNVNKAQTNTSNNTLAKAGIEDYPSAILITILIAASVYGYIKIRKYNAM